MHVEETPVDRSIVGVPTSITAFVGPTRRGPSGEPVELTSLAEFERTFGAEPGALRTAVAQYFAAGGGRAVAVAAAGEDDLVAALAALDAVELFNLLCVAAPADASIRQAASQLCRARRALYIADPDPTWIEPPRSIDDFKQGMALENSALYFPPAAGPGPVGAAVAGTIARLDAERGVGAAPAGSAARLRGVERLALQVDDDEGARLNALGINVLRVFPHIRGPVIWGARTLADDGDWKYVNVRRTALFVEESIDRGLRWVVFEPNDEPLWAQVRLQVARFLDQLFRDGTLQGSRPQEAYFVKCDRETVTQADVDAGRLVVLVGIATLRPAEFVILRFTHDAVPPTP